MARIEDAEGNLIEIQNDEGVINIEDLKKSLEEAKGNPKVISVLEKIVQYLEKEG